MTQLKATCIISADSQLERKACTQKAGYRDALAIIKYRYQT
jgi:hypothetical protein